MTIGIGATGPNAGLAVFKALAAAEAVCEHRAIGGFAVFCAITADGQVRYAQTQRGGTDTLFTLGDTTGVAPPPDIASARLAAVISSGPDRPEPLTQYILADPEVGIVTGHRFPQTVSKDGKALNISILDNMRSGMSPEAALSEVLSNNPKSDAGMIALSTDAQIAYLNSQRVAQRTDAGSAQIHDTEAGAGVAVLYNGLTLETALGDLLAEVAMRILCPPRSASGSFMIRAGIQAIYGEEDGVEIDNGQLIKLVVSDPLLLKGLHNCAIVYRGCKVVRNGEVVGFTMNEPNALVEDGRVVSVSGHTEMLIDYLTPQ